MRFVFLLSIFILFQFYVHAQVGQQPPLAQMHKQNLADAQAPRSDETMNQPQHVNPMEQNVAPAQPRKAPTAREQPNVPSFQQVRENVQQQQQPRAAVPLQQQPQPNSNIVAQQAPVKPSNDVPMEHLGNPQAGQVPQPQSNAAPSQKQREFNAVPPQRQPQPNPPPLSQQAPIQPPNVVPMDGLDNLQAQQVPQQQANAAPPQQQQQDFNAAPPQRQPQPNSPPVAQQAPVQHPNVVPMDRLDNLQAKQVPQQLNAVPPQQQNLNVPPVQQARVQPSNSQRAPPQQQKSPVQSPSAGKGQVPPVQEQAVPPHKHNEPPIMRYEHHSHESLPPKPRQKNFEPPVVIQHDSELDFYSRLPSPQKTGHDAINNVDNLRPFVSLTVNVTPAVKDCYFYEALTGFDVDVQVLGGDGMDIGLSVFDPSGAPVVVRDPVPEASVS